MDIKELKDKIKNHNLDDSMLIFKYTDNLWLVNSYVKEIARIRGKEIFYLESLSSMESIVDTNNYLYVFNTDEFNSEVNYKNLIIITKKSTLEKIIEFPKLESWQLQEYIKNKLPGLDKEDTDYLFNITKNNVYLIEREVNKIAPFLKTSQKQMFDLLKRENNYNYLSNYNSFELVNIIIKKDLDKISTHLNNVEEVEPMGLITLLLNQYRNIIKVRMSSKDTTPEKLGFDAKRYNAIQYSSKNYTDKELIDNFEFLTSIDYRLKEGLLDMSKKDLFYYILGNLL